MSRVFGLFGYKRDGKFAKCVWGLFATSSAIVVAFFALASVEEDGLIKFIDGYRQNSNRPSFTEGLMTADGHITMES